MLLLENGNPVLLEDGFELWLEDYVQWAFRVLLSRAWDDTTLTLTAVAEYGVGPYAYAWQEWIDGAWVDIDDEDGDVLVLTGRDPKDKYRFRVVTTDAEDNVVMRTMSFNYSQERIGMLEGSLLSLSNLLDGSIHAKGVLP